MLARQATAKQRYEYHEQNHTSTWYNQSANKEADEHGSRASISVDGLRLSERHKATLVLGEMVQIARKYFYDLHTPEPPSTARATAQDKLLQEVKKAYGPIPPPTDQVTGHFSLSETAPLP